MRLVGPFSDSRMLDNDFNCLFIGFVFSFIRSAATSFDRIVAVLFSLGVEHRIRTFTPISFVSFRVMLPCYYPYTKIRDQGSVIGSDRGFLPDHDEHHDRVDRDRRSSGSYRDTPTAIVIAIRKIDDQAKNRDHDRDQNGDRQTLK